jgi:uncharacterized membrane protein YhaH (DUF805 family)
MDWKWLFFSFDGRINRAKFWVAVLVLIVVALLLVFAVLPLFGLGPTTMGATAGGPIVSLVLTLIFAYPWTAVMVKRLNDRERPIWLVAVFWTPTVIGIIGQLTGATVAMQEVAGQQMMMPNTFGWIVNLLSFAIGIWALVELGILKGTEGANRHGPDPRGAGA